MSDDFNISPLITGIVLLLGLFIIIVTIIIMSKNKPDDGTCKSDNDCESTEKCTNGLCKLINGQSCTADGQCSSNLCQTNICTDPQSGKPSPIRSSAFGESPKNNYVFIPSNDVFVENTPSPTFDDDLMQLISPSYEVSSGNSNVSSGKYDMNYCSGYDSIYRKVPFANVIDAVTYSTSNVYILHNNEIYRDDIRIKHNLNDQIKGVVVYRGFLIVLSGGLLYSLPSNEYMTENWTFYSADAIIGEESSLFGGIIHIGSTNKQDYLIIQTHSGLYIIGDEGVVEEQQYNRNFRRIYGNNLNEWVEIDKSSTNQEVKFNKNGNIQTFYYISDAVIDHLGKLIPLPAHQAKEQNLTGILILSWKPQYLYSS